MFKGGYIKLSFNRTDAIEVYAGDESCGWGSRRAQFPVELSIKVCGNDTGRVVVVHSLEEFNNIHQKLVKNLWTADNLADMVVKVLQNGS